MIGVGNLLLRLAIWFLLTAHLSWVNILIGVIIALVLPRNATSPERLRDLLPGLGKILLAIPQAYKEAIELILCPHTEEKIVLESVIGRRTPGVIFLDIFLITFTPKTMVLNYHGNGQYEVHCVHQRQR